MLRKLKKNPGAEPKTCEKGLKLGFEYLLTSKTSHCVRTACMAFPLNAPAMALHAVCPCANAFSYKNQLLGGAQLTFYTDNKFRPAKLAKPTNENTPLGCIKQHIIPIHFGPHLCTGH